MKIYIKENLVVVNGTHKRILDYKGVYVCKDVSANIWCPLYVKWLRLKEYQKWIIHTLSSLFIIA